MFPSIRRPFSDTESRAATEVLARAVMEYLNALDPDDASRILGRHPILLDDETLIFLDGMIVMSRRESDDAARGLLGNWERLRDLLDDAITDGIPAAVARAKQRGERDVELVLGYFSLPTVEVRDFVERRRSTLLDEDRIERMRKGLAVLTEVEGTTQSEYIELRIWFLSDARTQGIEAAWNTFLARAAWYYVANGAWRDSSGREE